MAYVMRKTIWDSVMSKPLKAGEPRVCKVGKHKLLVEKTRKHNHLGYVIYTARVVNPDGSLGKQHKCIGSAAEAVSFALETEGVQTKSPKSKYFTGKSGGKRHYGKN